ncbi:nucleotidyltransferase domain-containing protein [Ignisphaera sp. 4213-co]|uniref:Nucleotidyltransferase domain-containing protein n=1 Tax=Ignisphaera cupida TaxID=3050454 RepID=A0ABD4Z666_9CREN|nr:nucleotidyltransferase domain-containing protein [Ignisphaera sp. 4213-co]MDK6028655.1 nucleotidyltransferase domain-containing protein [Ignisphaera sp. 4213-co]
MSLKEFKIYIEYSKRIRETFSNPIEFLKKVKEDILKMLPNAEIYLFGSVSRGKYTLSSDIDVLIVVDNLEGVDVDLVKAKIKKKYIDNPLEIHLIDRKILKNWYSKFIQKEELIKI